MTFEIVNVRNMARIHYKRYLERRENNLDPKIHKYFENEFLVFCMTNGVNPNEIEADYSRRAP